MSDETPSKNLDTPELNYEEVSSSGSVDIVTPQMREKSFNTTGEYLSDKDIARNTTPDYYGAKCVCGRKLDPYTICDAYDTKHTGSAWHHAVKKLLRVGNGHKSLNQDIQEVINTLTRWQEQLNQGVCNEPK